MCCAHANAGQNKVLYLGHPVFEGFETVRVATVVKSNVPALPVGLELTNPTFADFLDSTSRRRIGPSSFEGKLNIGARPRTLRCDPSPPSTPGVNSVIPERTAP